MNLTEERRGQIAIEMVKNLLNKNGVRLTPSMRREIGAQAKEMHNVRPEELEQFMLDLLPQMIGNAFGYDSVGLTTGGRRTTQQ